MKKFQYIVVNPTEEFVEIDLEDQEDQPLEYESCYKAGCISLGLIILPLVIFFNVAN